MPKSANQPISKPAGKLDAPLAALDRSHRARQNAKAVPVKTHHPKRPKLR